MKLALALLVACRGDKPRDDKPVITPARALEVRCELGKPAEPPPGMPSVLAGKRVWLYATDVLTVTGEKGLIAAITPPEKRIPVAGGAPIAHGLAIVAHGASTWYLAQLDLGGAPHGAVLALPGIAAGIGRIRVEAFADTVVLLEQSSTGALIQEYSLDAKPVGDPTDLGAIGIDDFARIGTSHAFLLRYREHSNTPAQLRIYDGDAHAWAGPAVASTVEIAGTAPFGDALLLVGTDGNRMIATTLDAKGAQSAPKELLTRDAIHVEAPVTDGTRVFAVWTSDRTVHVAQILPDLHLGPEVSFPGEVGGANTASDTTIYVSGKTLTCR